MRTINLKIEDSMYDEIVNSGINIQEELKKTLTKLVLNRHMHSQQFKKDKQYFNNVLSEIESGELELIPFDNGLSELDDFIDNVR